MGSSPVSVDQVLPPHSLEAEKAVLGAILRDPDQLHIVVDLLKPEHFFIDNHKAIMLAISEIYGNNESVDIITVADKLRKHTGKSDPIGPAFLVELTENCPVSQNIEYYAAIVRRYFFLRRIIKTCQSTIQTAFACDGTVESFIEDVEREFLSIANDQDRRGIFPADKVLESTIDLIQKNLERGNTITGIPSGFYELDDLSGGWQASDLIILAARPGMGKTAFILNCAISAVRNNKSVVFFTLEMTKEQLMSRILASEARIDSSRIRRGEMSDEDTDRLMEGARQIYNLHSKFGIDETPSLTLIELRSRCRRFKKEHGLDLIIIDYLQLMGSASLRRPESREREISEISMGLKALAKELNVPVIALAQLNRSPESRPDRRPRLSDLRESGSMEQDADMILFVYRDEYYNPNSEKSGIAEIIIGKNRHGPTKTIELAFQPNFVTFQNLMKV